MEAHMSKRNSDDQETAKQTNSFQRAPIFKGLALQVADQMELLSLQKTRVLRTLDVQGALRAKALAKEARALAFKFEGWMQQDVPAAERTADVVKLRAIEAAAAALSSPGIPRA
jgi:hypothetical protein